MKFKFLNTALITLSITFTGIVNAGIIAFNINDTVTQGTGTSDANGCGTGSIGGVIDGFNLMLDPGCSNGYLDLQLINGEFWVLPASNNDLDALSAGSVISNGTFFSGGVNSWNYVLDGVVTADFTTSFTDMFLGFKTGNGKYGYIEIDWIFSQGQGTLYLGNGAYENVAGVAIVTPSTDVPEPSTLAIFALGMIGLASRRFKKLS